MMFASFQGRIGACWLEGGHKVVLGSGSANPWKDY
jgi:hypothetical protein